MPKGHPGTKYRICSVCLNCGKIIKIIESAYRKGYGQYCSKSCSKQNQSFETKNKIRTSLLGRPKTKESIRKRSMTIIIKNGGFLKTSLKKIIYATQKMYEWKKCVLERDNYTCQCCDKSNKKMHVHHIIPYAMIINVCNIKTIYDALECEILWDIDNGTTYCKKCHNMLHSKKYRE